MYDIKAGICSSTADPVIVREMGATAHVDGKNCLGPVVGDYAMAVACQKAREFGVGWVVAKGKCELTSTVYYCRLDKTIYFTHWIVSFGVWNFRIRAICMFLSL